MKRSVTTVVAVTISLTMAACGQAEAERPDGSTDASAVEAALSPSRAADPGAPTWAALYPGAEVTTPPVTGGDGATAGGLVAFTTPASPEQVIDFYRKRAEAAGLVSASAMSQGEARAYAASDAKGSGADLQVVASPVDDVTSVQLSWSAGAQKPPPAP